MKTLVRAQASSVYTEKKGNEPPATGAAAAQHVVAFDGKVCLRSSWSILSPSQTQLSPWVFAGGSPMGQPGRLRDAKGPLRSPPLISMPSTFLMPCEHCELRPRGRPRSQHGTIFRKHPVVQGPTSSAPSGVLNSAKPRDTPSENRNRFRCEWASRQHPPIHRPRITTKAPRQVPRVSPSLVFTA